MIHFSLTIAVKLAFTKISSEEFEQTLSRPEAGWVFNWISFGIASWNLQLSEFLFVNLDVFTYKQCY